MSYIKKKEPPIPKKSLINLIRVNNLIEEISDSQVKALFSKYGEILHYSRPRKQGGLKLSRHAFIQFKDSDSCELAINNLNGFILENTDITVNKVIESESIFSEETGYITGINLDKFRTENEFDSTMPSTHRLMKQLEALKYVDVVYTIKISNLDNTITENMLNSIFKEFGQISTIEYPIHKISQKHKDYAYIRYTHFKSAVDAIEKFNNQHILYDDTSSPIIKVEMTSSNNVRYFSQDENQAFR